MRRRPKEQILSSVRLVEAGEQTSNSADKGCGTDCADCDIENPARAIANGISTHTAENPAYWIHTGGTGILSYLDVDKKTFGEESKKMHDDWDNVSELTSLPDFAIHRNVDKIILETGAKKPDGVKTVIVCPPLIYGQGRGPSNQTTNQVPEMTNNFLKRKKPFHVGAGKNWWNIVHVHDLSDLYLKIAEAAASGGGKVTWGPKEGYYLAENGERVWGNIARDLAKLAHEKGVVDTAEVEGIPSEEADGMIGGGAIRWGSNSRGKAIRARKTLGWNPTRPELEEWLPEIVDIRAKALGAVPKGHAETVTS